MPHDLAPSPVPFRVGMELTAHELWSRVLHAARASLTDQSFRTWLAGTRPVALSDDALVVEAISEFHAEWLEDKYGPLLTGLLQREVGRSMSLSFQASTDDGAVTPPPVEVSTEGSSGEAQGPIASGAPDRPAGLLARYTFSRFVVGDGNELAAAASRAVAHAPARTYNPLFLYGGVGLGKTHLMHAIGLEVLAGDPSRQVAYVPSEQFTNELVSAIQRGSTAAFRRRYRFVDVLLVDDVHFLAGKERTQEEFFHTFNALYDAQKQIVLASDRPPREMPGLEDRLVSRFEWGLLADIKPPDYETRIAILRKKAADDDLVLPSDVIDFVARSCRSSVRELEGAMIKLLAYSSLTRRTITVELARAALGTYLAPSPDEGALTVERIRELVAASWNVTPASLGSRRRTRELMIPRQIAMYLTKTLLDLPLVRIGQLYGGRDHSTVIHSIRRVEELINEQPDLRRAVEALTQQLQKPL